MISFSLNDDDRIHEYEHFHSPDTEGFKLDLLCPVACAPGMEVLLTDAAMATGKWFVVVYRSNGHQSTIAMARTSQQRLKDYLEYGLPEGLDADDVFLDVEPLEREIEQHAAKAEGRTYQPHERLYTEEEAIAIASAMADDMIMGDDDDE